MWGIGTLVLGGPTGGLVIINFIGNLVQEWTFRHGFFPRKSFSKLYSPRTKKPQRLKSVLFFTVKESLG